MKGCDRTITLIALLLQTLLGYDATPAGMVLAMGGIATIIMMPVVGVALKKYDAMKIARRPPLTLTLAFFEFL